MDSAEEHEEGFSVLKNLDWRPFDFNFEPQYLWSNLIFFLVNLLALIVLFAFSHKIKPNDFIKAYVVMSIYAPVCLCIFGILFSINRLLNLFYIHHLVMETVCRIFNGIAKGTFLFSSMAVLLLASYVAVKRRPMSVGAAWGPFCFVVVFAIIWLFFFANRLHLVFLIINGCLVSLAICVVLCCSFYRFGEEVERIIGDARSRLFWTACFVAVFLGFYAYAELLYGNGNDYVFNTLRSLQYVLLLTAVVLLLPPYRDILFCKKEPVRMENDPSYMRNTESSLIPSSPPSAPPLDARPSNPVNIYPTYPASYGYPAPQQYPFVMHHSVVPVSHPGVILHPSHSIPLIHQPRFFYVNT